MGYEHMPLAGKVALITGAGRGMGQAHALRLAAMGADIVVNDLVADAAEDTAAAVRERGRRALAVACNVADSRAVAAMVEQAADILGPITILVNNAGIDQRRKLEEIDDDDLERMLAVHVKAAFYCARAVVPAMKAAQFGRIVNVSSMWGMTGTDLGASHYCAAKAALLGATKSWAKELAPFGIQVNAIAPGGVRSAMTLAHYGEEGVREKEMKVPLGRWALPEEIAATVAFLVSPEAEVITGQTISPNCGEVIVGI